MAAPSRLTDRELFAARPWRAGDRTQLIVAVVESDGVAAGAPDSPWYVVVAGLQGRVLFSRPLAERRTPASFSEAELETLYEAARAAVVS